VLYEVDKASGSPYVLHTDAQGSVRVITDSAANVVESYYNDEYGNPLVTLSASVPNNVASQPLQYTAEPRDPETGFIYLRARMYDPSIGRFLQQDGLSGKTCTPITLNRYSYVLSDPLSFTDHSGHAAYDLPFCPVTKGAWVKYSVNRSGLIFLIWTLLDPFTMTSRLEGTMDICPTSGGCDNTELFGGQNIDTIAPELHSLLITRVSVGMGSDVWTTIWSAGCSGNSDVPLGPPSPI
jgi:RHS repeat-associated protein